MRHRLEDEELIDDVFDLRPALWLHAQDRLADEIAAVGVEHLDREIRSLRYSCSPRRGSRDGRHRR